MCGIAGTLELRRGATPDEDLVVRMTDLIAHRGPDDAGLFVDAPVVLGHRRLSILDLSPAGHQPMRSHDGRYWITFNGEIYNYKELAEELRAEGQHFATTCDTEVLLAAYEQWGKDALPRLNGMFAFVIWDAVRQELFCVRDRVGVKPFYYTIADGRFRFASEIKALLLDPAVPRVANDARVLDFLAYGYTDHTSETLFEGILQLPPGCCMVVRPDERPPQPERWYELHPAPHNGTPPKDMLRERLLDAVALRLRSDVPVGTTLSGGLDSSAVTAMATLLRRRESLPPAQTFSSRCEDPRIDEGPYMQRVLDQTGAPNIAFTPTVDGLVDSLDQLIWHMDEPFHSAAVYGHWQMSQLARSSGVTVLLDGQGGDEALAGYEYLIYPGFFYTAVTRGRVRQAVSEALRRQEVQGASFQHSLRQLVKVMLPASIRAQDAPPWIGLRDQIEPPPLPARSLLDHHRYGLAVQPLPMYNHQLDRNTMSVSLEARNPFLDYRVIECGLGLSPEDHIRGGYTKWTLREAVRDILPAEVVDRPRKQGFTTDEETWIRSGELSEAIEETFQSEAFASRPYFDRDAMLSLLERHRAGERHEVPIWRAYIVERWLEFFIDAPAVATPGGSFYDHARRLSSGDAVTRPAVAAETTP